MRRRTIDYLAAGQLANLDQFASVTSSTVTDGPAHGCRALDLRVAGGIDVRVLPDRGLDIGAARYAGVPLAWISAAGERAPLSALPGSAWLEAFGGGLVTTCGLRNVGAASEGHGLHGRYSHLAARSVTVEREVQDGEVLVSARATISEVAALGPQLRLERRIRTRTDRGLLELRWQAATLPRLHQWVHPAPGIYALALEPANCSVLGRAADRAAGRLPLLAVGEVRTTELEIRVDPVEL